MARPSVAIRLATEGKAQVQRDFADIADAGGAHAARLRAKWEAETSQIERLTDRAAKTAERLAAVSSTPVQSRINAATGVGGSGATGAAQASAKALAQELDRAEREAVQLLSAIDPLFAAQTRYAQQVDRINDLKRAGVLTEKSYQQLIEHEKTLLEQATVQQQRYGAAKGRTGMITVQASQQFQDFFIQVGNGQNVIAAGAMQLSQLAFVMQGAQGTAGRFATFLSGPWGAAAIGMVTILGLIVPKLLDMAEGLDDASAKLAKQKREAQLTEQAEAAYANTLDGVTESLRKNREALAGLADAGKSAAERALDHARSELTRLRLLELFTKETIRATKAQIELNRARNQVAGQDPRITGPLSAESDAIADRLKALESTLPGFAKQITEAENQIADAASRVAVERGSEDAVERIKRSYNSLVEETRKRLLAEKATTEEIEKQTRALRAKEAAEIKAEQDRGRQKNDVGDLTRFGSPVDGGRMTGRFGERRPGHNHAGVDFAVPVGSEIKAAAGGTVITAGTLPGYGNVIIVDHGRGTTTRYAHLSQLLVGKGDAVDQGTLLGLSGGAKGAPGAGNSQGPHLHFEVRRGGRAVDPTKGEFPTDPALAGRGAAAAAERLAERQLRLQNDFEERRSRLNEQLLRAQGEMVLGYQAQAENARKQIEADFKTEQLKIQNDVQEGKLTEAQAAELNLANERVMFARLFNQALEDRLHNMEEADRSAAQAAQFQIDGLEYSEEIARTQGERRDLQRQILDLQYQEKLRHLEYLKAQADLVGNTEEAARIQAEINNLPAERARDDERSRRGTMGPLEEFLDKIPASAKEAEEALEGLAVQGLQAFTSGAGEAIVEADNFKEALHALGELGEDALNRLIAALIELGIQMLIIKPIAQALGVDLAGLGGGAGGGAGTGGGGGGGGGWIGTAISGLASILGSVFGGGGGGGGGGSPMFTPSNPGVGYGVGTHYFGGGMAWVGEHGRELVHLPRGSRISPAAESRRIAAAANDAGPRVELTNYNDFRGADAAAVGAIQARLDQMEADLPARVLSSMHDAKSRLMWRGN